MKKDSAYNKFFFLGICCLVLLYFTPLNLIYKIPPSLSDLSYRYINFLRKNISKPLSFKIIGIAVDENSLNRISQRWPFRRSLYAKAIQILDKEKVNTIGLDFIFDGESEDRNDDLILKEALSSASAHVVLAYLFDYESLVPVLPLKEFRESAHSLGMLNTPPDADGNIRRLRSFIKFKNETHYSLSVRMAASYLGEQAEEVVSRLPLLRDKTFFISYQRREKDIIISFADLLDDLEGLKAKHGKDFLRGGLVLIYPEAEIAHDIHATPLGRMPGGMLHLNGVADILSDNLLRTVLVRIGDREVDILSLLFSIGALFTVSYFIARYGFLTAFLCVLGAAFLGFWFLVLLNLGDIKFDYSEVVVFILLFFTAGSLYKYAYSLSQLLKIKNKATLDPLRGLYTLRYFYYRLQLEQEKFYFYKNLYLVFARLDSFKEETAGMPIENVKNLWQQVHSALAAKRGFWSVYSPDELAGALYASGNEIRAIVQSLKKNLDILFREKDIKATAKLGYVKIRKGNSVKEILFTVSSGLRKSNEGIIFFKDNELAEVGRAEIENSNNLLDTMDADIEERNRELLSLIERLNKEHAKVKEAFFQIIASLANALEARDPYTEGHSQRVTNYALMTAEKLNWNTEQKEKLKKAGLLHDLGKIGIPDSILHKKGRLTDDEYDIIRKHEVIGVKILEPLKEIQDIIPWILYHHERWDGKGYPHGLAGQAIPEAAQVIALSDVYDALTTGRDYKDAMSWENAIQEIIRNKGTQFSPELTDVFVAAISESRLQGRDVKKVAF